MKKFEKDTQLTLAGATMSQEEWAAAVSKVPSLMTRCPFCLGAQNLREMLFANADGVLANMRRCRFCHKKMRKDSAVVFLQGADKYGEWVATYPDFWKSVNHERFMEQLEHLHKIGVMKPWEFWIAYRKVKPKKLVDADGYPLPEKPEEYEDKDAAVEHKWPEEEGLTPVPTADGDRLRWTKKEKVETFVFRSKEDPKKFDYVQGERVDEEADCYVIVYGQLKQKYQKRGWEKID